MGKYLQILEGLTAGQKIEFLEKILLNSSDLQSQLINYFPVNEQVVSSIPIDFNQIVIEESTYYKEILEEIDLEETDYGRWHDRHDRYYEEWEIAQEIAEKDINDLFDSFQTDFILLAAQGDLNTMMAKFTGLLIACNEAIIDDPYGNIRDIDNFLAECLGRVANSVDAEINKTVLNSQTIQATIYNILDCFVSGEANKFPSHLHDTIIHRLLRSNSDNCSDVFLKFNSIVECKTLFPKSYIQATRIGNPSTWISEAEKMSLTNVDIAIELLEYQAENNQAEFHRNAKILFPLFSRELVELVSTSMDDVLEKQFAKEVLSYKVMNNRMMDDYIRLSVLFTDNEKHYFINSLALAHNYKFYIQVLAYEKLYEKILLFAQDPKRQINECHYIIPPIIHKYPSDCFYLVEKMTRVYLEQNMSRDHYNNAAQLLKLVASDKENATSVNKLVLEFCTLYSRRVAMKDEFKKVGLLK